NYETINIVQTDIFGNTISGQVFYLEFPPVDKLGVRFINSSPIYNPVPAQYLCQGNLTNLDFSAQDPDGDSLVYTMVTPLRGDTYLSANSYSTANTSDPTYPSPGPYALIGWQPGYSATNAIPGKPSLKINSKTGILTVNPSNTGLYAFAVACDEYRGGVKIGQVRRDFQFLVLSCPITYKPSVGINSANNGNSNSGNTNWGNFIPDTLIVNLNRDTCYTIFVTDSSASYYNSTAGINIFYGSTNLPTTSFAFSPSLVTVTPAMDTATMKMCFSPCDKILILKDSIYYLDIIVQTTVCPKKSDTLRTYVHVVVETNNKPPTIRTSLFPMTTLQTYPDTLTKFYVYGFDPDSFDITTITATPNKFSFTDYRMQFTSVYQGVDSLAYLFEWIPNCSDLKKQVSYKINFNVTDKSCIYTHTVNTGVILNLRDAQTELPDIHPPNLITPNGDNLNDCFYIPNMPPDNCTYIFKSVEIYSRWGEKVFHSSSRNFQWCPSDYFSDGIYYFGIDLTAKYIKGWLQITR
ncbi:MAG TPA: gliding motility-associated C-terminal domain-containing protein, partial [Cytophagaceae bacterium]|nr:gliding motility-associated C-terminal domain-containing protein [Cytophagaceae bacterium]